MEKEDYSSEKSIIEPKPPLKRIKANLNFKFEDGMKILESPEDSRFDAKSVIAPCDDFSQESDVVGLANHIRGEIIRSQNEVKNLGLPIEEFAIEIPGVNNSIRILNYCDSFPLDSEKLDKIVKSFSLILSNCKDGIIGIKNIIIRPEIRQLENGENQNGEINADTGSIFLYQPAFEDKPYRTDGVDRLLATIIHEWAHQYMSSFESSKFYSEWIKLGGWKLKEGIDLSKVADPYFEINTRPEECLNDYCRLSSGDDFCDSVAAALLNPKLLESISPDKLDFIKRNIFKDRTYEDTKLSVTRKDLDYPKFPNIFYYSLFVLNK